MASTKSEENTEVKVKKTVKPTKRSQIVNACHRSLLLSFFFCSSSDDTILAPFQVTLCDMFA